jgi:hypothetical protein
VFGDRWGFSFFFFFKDSAGKGCVTFSLVLHQIRGCML